MVGVSDHTLRHYDKIGLLRPAAVDRDTGYRWYGVPELTRLERIRGLQRLGLSLRQISDVIDSPDDDVRQVLTETVATMRRDLVSLSAALSAAEDQLAGRVTILPQETTVVARRLRVRHLRVAHPSELAGLCPEPPSILLTWLSGPPSGSFTAAVASDRTGDTLALPTRRVVRTTVPPSGGVVRAGQELFGWLHRNGLAVDGPTMEEHLRDGDGVHATVLEIPVRPAEPSSVDGPVGAQRTDDAAGPPTRPRTA